MIFLQKAKWVIGDAYIYMYIYLYKYIYIYLCMYIYVYICIYIGVSVKGSSKAYIGCCTF